MGQELARRKSEDGSVSGGVEDVSDVVASQEKIESAAPPVVYLIFLGLPLLFEVFKSGVSLSALVVAVVGYFASRFVLWLLRLIIIHPLHERRYDRAAARLKIWLKQLEPVSAGPFSWTLGAPGAMAIARAGRILIVDRSTRYEALTIDASQIADVVVKRTSQIVTDTRHSGQTTIAAFGGSVGMGQTLGGRSMSVTRSIDSYVLEIRYQIERNGAVRTAFIPGGDDHRVVEELCALVRRLQA